MQALAKISSASIIHGFEKAGIIFQNQPFQEALPVVMLEDDRRMMGFAEDENQERIWDQLQEDFEFRQNIDYVLFPMQNAPKQNTQQNEDSIQDEPAYQYVR
ncbi:Hypothetical_protein [Hexamita inflata]|uniref:Hypothetical_protein n=1 Tax=Hexamita inflata TaxID=28002 RepID=A0AA86U6E6_9EUKA|nr:Hypothetical protein HINF_LOCUS32280 [Hexamita inflata]